MDFRETDRSRHFRDPQPRPITDMIALLTATILAPQTFSTPRVLPSLKSIAVCPGPGSTFFVTTEDNMVRHVNAATGATARQFPGHPQPVYGVAVNRAGTVLATGDETGRIWLWNVKTGAKIKEFPRNAQTHQRGIQALSFSLDGKTLATTGKDDQIIIWNVATATPTSRMPSNGNNVSSATYAGTNIWAATLGAGVWRYKGATLAGKIPAHGSQGAVDFKCDPAGTRAITGGRDGSIILWNLTAGKQIASKVGHEDSVTNLAMSPNGKVGASSCSVDRTVKFWNMSNGAVSWKLDEQSAVGAPITFTGDGKYFISANIQDQVTVHTVAPAQGVAPVKSKKRR